MISVQNAVPMKKPSKLATFINAIYEFLGPKLTNLEIFASSVGLVNAAVILLRFTKLIGLLGMNILKALSTPLTFALIAFRDLLSLGTLFTNSAVKQKKTKVVTTLLRLGLVAVGFSIILGSIIAPPFAIPLLFVGFVKTVVYAEWYSRKQTKAELENLYKNHELYHAEENLKKALSETHDHALIQKLAKDLYQTKLNLGIPQKIIALKYSEKRKNTSLKTLIAIGCMLGSILFPPLFIIGSALIFSANIDKKELKENELSEMKALSNVDYFNKLEIRALSASQSRQNDFNIRVLSKPQLINS